MKLSQHMTEVSHILHRYASSPGHRTYCYAELCFFPRGDWKLPKPLQVDFGGWLHTEVV